ncbi:MAG TPA: glycine cleavage T C-terminal barrel domain-containing protein [Oscillatoriaceae cyanobacterium]
MPNPRWPAVAWRPEPTRGRLRVGGADRQAFLQNMTTNDVRTLVPGHGQPTVLVNQRAGILDWLGLYAEPETILLVTGPGCGETDTAWLDRYVFSEDVTFSDITGTTVLYYLTGRDAESVARALVPDLGTFAIADARLDGHDVKLLGTVGLEGPGYYLLGPAVAASALSAWLAERGAALSDSDHTRWRIETGVPEVGAELDERHNPWEARLDESVSLHKGCYLGQEIVARLYSYHKVQRYLVGFDLPRDVPAGAKIYADDQEVGAITSACPTEAGAIALGYVKSAVAEPGKQLTVVHDDDRLPATVSDRPFWAHLDRKAGLAPSS